MLDGIRCGSADVIYGKIDTIVATQRAVKLKSVAWLFWAGVCFENKFRF